MTRRCYRSIIPSNIYFEQISVIWFLNQSQRFHELSRHIFAYLANTRQPVIFRELNPTVLRQYFCVSRKTFAFRDDQRLRENAFIHAEEDGFCAGFAPFLRSFVVWTRFIWFSEFYEHIFAVFIERKHDIALLIGPNLVIIDSFARNFPLLEIIVDIFGGKQHFYARKCIISAFCGENIGFFGRKRDIHAKKLSQRLKIPSFSA